MVRTVCRMKTPVQIPITDRVPRGMDANSSDARDMSLLSTFSLARRYPKDCSQ